MSGLTLKETAAASIPTPATGKATIFQDDTAHAPKYKDDAGATHALVGPTGSVGPGYAATSTTSFAIGTGSKAFTTQAGLAYTAGARVRATSAAAPTTNYMEGVVSAYSGTTLTVTMDLVGGSGTHTDWDINLAGNQGVPGAGVPPTVTAHGSMGSTETFNYSTSPAHEGTLDASCTITLTGAVAGECILVLGLTEDGTGGWTITLPGSVANAAAIVAAMNTAAGAYNLILLRTVDSGTTWYGLVVGPGATGAIGPTGGAIAIPYTFSTTTTDSDPGNGNLRLSNATQTSATVIRADLLSSDTTDWSAVLATLADSTNTVKGHIRLFKTSDPTKWLVFTVSSLASPSGYKNITVVNVAGSAASPFSNGDAITLAFTRTGDVGASGTASVGTDPIWDAAGDLAVGTGADAAARLAMGTALQSLRVNAGATALEYYTPAPWTKLVDENGTSFTNWANDVGSWSSDATDFIVNAGAGVTAKMRYTLAAMGSPLRVDFEVFFDSTGTSQAGGSLFMVGLGTSTNPSHAPVGGLKYVSNNPAANGQAYAEEQGSVAYAGPASTFAMDTWLTMRVDISSTYVGIYKSGTLIWGVNIQSGASSYGAYQLLFIAYANKVKVRNIKAYQLTAP